MMSNKTPGGYLKDKQRQLREGFETNFGIRVHRSISWLLRSEREKNDPDARFIFLWIAFNGAYSVYENRERAVGLEREKLRKFLSKMVEVDRLGEIYDIVWENYSSQIRSLLSNHYVFAPFWNFQNRIEGYEAWEEMFDQSQREVNRSLRDRNSVATLVHVFDRLYVLRNQLIHGGSTWNGQVNRPQVRNGADVMSMLVPIMINLMLDNAELDWGDVHYQVIDPP